MSADYDPDPGTNTSVPPQSTIFLSQRDLGLKVPINFVTQPGVSFSTACFPKLVFEDESFETCFSNLLAVGFRRFEVDVYWDEAQETWSLCPVSVATNIPSAGTTSLKSVLSTTLPASVLSDTASAGTTAPGPFLSSSVLTARQVSNQPNSSSVSTTSSGSHSSLNVRDSTAAQLSFPPYKCTATISLPTLMNFLNNYIGKTQNNLAAHLIYVILNIHAAASAKSPTLAAPSPSILPSSPEFLGELFLANMSAFLYTPSNLLSERTNLNSSWFTVPEIYRPSSGYYNTNTNEVGILSTDDGWPSESYIEFSKNKRLLVGYGSVDPQMSKYNFTEDAGTIFPTGFIQGNQTTETDTSGNVTSGCFAVSDLTDITPKDINSSWATSSATNSNSSTTTASITSTLNLSSSLIRCGISPILNITLLNTTAQENYIPYQNYSYSTLWTWAPDEPRIWSAGNPGSDSLFRCARTSPNSLHGKWYVGDCSVKNYAACRMPSQPYNWTLTTYETSYSYASAACPSPYIFSAPQTSLENAYLHQTLLSIYSHRGLSSSRSRNGSGGVWLNFNSIDMKGCWVTGGINASCPYRESTSAREEVQRRTILVPTIAAIIVLIITLLTVFVKVMGNRYTVKSRRGRRKRKRDGVFYEGVPS